jgi:hypothetical protein
MKILYLLQVRREKLSHENFKLLRSLLYFILQREPQCAELSIELHFD